MVRYAARRTFAAAVLACTALAMASPAWPQTNRIEAAFNELERQSRTGKGEYAEALVGMIHAYEVANVELETVRKQPVLYCLPEVGAFDYTLLAFITVGEYRANKSLYDKAGAEPLTLMSMALLKGLQSAFKCKGP